MRREEREAGEGLLQRGEGRRAAASRHGGEPEAAAARKERVGNGRVNNTTFYSFLKLGKKLVILLNFTKFSYNFPNKF